ncbi:class I adenylate-forming enzyme family protein [Gallicola sp. Sow4_E12]|uniref:class I adenylate-forming enzyme family protein n=1 Tax=Gallicola sp. Sow4_E12 TaxID=3438785 RepID=UPI003F8FC065
MVITDFLERNAKFYPDDTALVEVNPENQPEHGVTWREYNLIEQTIKEPYRREMTWQEFDQKANRFANFLLTRNVKKGDKIAILLMNQLEWLPIYFGILKTGALAVPLNYRYTASEIKYCAELAEVNTIIFGPEFTGRIEEIFGSLKNVKDFYYVGEEVPTFADPFNHMVNYCSSRAPAIELQEEDSAAIYFSSGTTGFPKAILHNHQSLMTAVLAEQNHHSQKKDDVFLCIPPLYHTGAKMHWFGSLMSGGKAVLLRGVSPEWIFETISKEHVTIVWLLVPWAQDILDAIDRGDLPLDQYCLDQLRLMHIGAQPVPPSLIDRWMEIFPHHQYDTNYGLSESIGPGCVHLGVENIHKVGAIGKAGYLWETKIVDEKGEECKAEEVGELLVKGPGLMTCYYNNEEATKESLKDGWLYTGDVAKMDEDGFIYLVDRKKDVIISGGENIYPVQIEDFLRAHSAIKDVAVIGIPDERLGEISAAIIEFKEGASSSEKEIEEFCEDLPRYKRPRRIIFDTIPRNPTGKIEKPALRKKYCGERLVEAQTKK